MFSAAGPRVLCFDFDVAVLGPFVIVLEMMFPEINGVAKQFIVNLYFKDPNLVV